MTKRYPPDTFSTEASDFKNVTVQRGSERVLQDECFDIAAAYASDDEKLPETAKTQRSISSRSTSSDQKEIRISTIQYRHFIIPPSKTIHTYTNFKLIVLQKERFFVLSCSINNSPSLAVLSLSYSKVLRIQFIRRECSLSSEWYIDFVLAPEASSQIDLKPFKAPPESAFSTSHIDTFSQFSTLRVYLDSNCGASTHTLDNILLSILNDRRAFYFAENKDHYGDFETSDRTSSPGRPKKSLSYSPSKSSISALNSSPRVVPSLESLYASDSVKLKSRRKTLIEDEQVYAPKSSPDVFESSSRRQSKRHRTSSPSNSSKEADYAYVDPEFESECVK